MILRALVAVVLVVVPACTADDGEPSGSDTTVAAPVSSPLRDRPLPPPVAITPEPGATLADPAFEALPGATAHWGRLGGTVYRIEMPEDWNGTLVMWMHGFGELRPEARVDAPDIRRYLVDHGIAWAASSFSSTSTIPSLAADETAALWDHVVDRFGRPDWTYVSGFSMGGWATHISAERYGDRYDGALALCGAVGAESALRVSVDQLVLAAHLAGVTQAEVDAAADMRVLLDTRVRPVLDDPATRERLVQLVVALTGGPRFGAAEGVEQELETNWERGRLLVSAHIAPRRTRPYELVGLDPAVAADLDARAVQFPVDDAVATEFARGMDQRGDLALPLLSLHTTGDGQVPIDQALALHDLVQAAGREDRLVSRLVEDPGHCGFTTAEQEQSFVALQRWVEQGRRPAGTDLSDRDLTALDRTFGLQPRTASAGETIDVTGTATVDGEALDADFVGAVVLDGGLVTPCQAAIPSVHDGAVDLPVLTSTASSGCARAGSRIALWTYVGEDQLYATPLDVRTLGDLEDVAIEFDTADPRAGVPATTGVHGEVYDATGERVTAGRVEARVGTEICGRSSIRSEGSFEGYIVSILRTSADGPCPEGATVTFTVDGDPVEQTIANTDQGRDAVDLTLAG
ncbi:MAG TPA: DUF6351 family protein [Iamia sp.]